MNIAYSKKLYRWVLFRHIGAPNDLKGIHFDLLLEDQEFCRTWRLSDIPLVDGPYVHSDAIAPHKLDWLDVEEKVVSGNRGVVTRVQKGIFLELLPSIKTSSIQLLLQWEDVECVLVIDENGCKILRKNSKYCL